MNLRLIIIVCIFSLSFCLQEAIAEKIETKNLTDCLVLKVESGNGSAKISWWPKNGPVRHKDAIKGIRVYQMKSGLESGYNIPMYTLVDDVKYVQSSSTVNKLKNGELYVFQIKAYDDRKKEFLESGLVAFPGSNPAGKPVRPANFYVVAGDGRTAIYWERNTEADLVGYEIYRKAPSDGDFRLLRRIPKVTRIESGENINQKIQVVTPGMFVDTAVENGKSYQYRIRAADSEGYFSEFTGIATARPAPYRPPSGENILLLVNADEGDVNHNGINDSEEVALHYAKLRGVPAKNILHIHLGGKPRLRSDTIADYESYIQKPIQEYLRKNELTGTIRYIVPCFGMPVRFAGRALDSKLADLFDRFTYGRNMGTPHPYYASSKHFDGTYGIYLVTRIDGPSPELAKGLIDKAIFAEKNVTPTAGTAYFASNGGWESSYKELAETRKIAASHNIKTVYQKGEFEDSVLPDDALWYFAIRHPYKNPKKGNWQPGAVGFHLISDSFYKIRKGTWDPRMKSWVEGLLEHGITATLGAVIEPYLQGYTKPDLFFKSFWSCDYDFAESFWQATPTVQWAMSAVGDPLYRLRK